MTIIAIPHGTRAGYIGTRARPPCRCADCHEADRLYRLSLIPSATHGRLSTYTLGCRCDECRREASERHRIYRDRPGYNASAKRMKATVDAIKDAPCIDCGGRFPSECMDFDHVRGEKKFTISHLSKAIKNIEKLKSELAKCELVCANCHRIRTRARSKGSL